MTNFNLQADYFENDMFAANFGPEPIREEEEWEIMLAEMKVAILRNENDKGRKLMYGLEFKIHEARMRSFNEGYQRGATPLPF